MKSFPVIDISYVIQNKETIFQNDEKIKDLCVEISKAFGEWGFIYLKGHGIPDKYIEQSFSISRDFFHLPLEEKNKVLLEGKNSEYTGYCPFKLETFDFSKPFDLKEAFDYIPYVADEIKSKIPSEFIKMFDSLYSKCHKIAMIILNLINRAFDIEDQNLFVAAHKKVASKGNITILRSLYYPAVEKKDLKDEQSRCGEHTDYGSITLLFQDATGGLEVQSPNGEFIEAVPIPGTIVVNSADLLERWTSGRIKSTRHRVVLPKDMSKARQSIAFFYQPDNDFVVKCLDGSDKYEPVSSYDYIDSQFNATYISEKK